MSSLLQMPPAKIDRRLFVCWGRFIPVGQVGALLLDMGGCGTVCDDW